MALNNQSHHQNNQQPGAEMRLFGKQEFSAAEKDTIRQLLEQKLGKEHLSERAGAAGSKYTYVESWKAIQLANQIFGFNGWSSSVVDVAPDFIEEDGARTRVGVTAIVKVMLKDGTFHEDVGYGICENPKKGTAIENAKKEAVTDARKRALRMFGNALGNCIYDKQHVKRFKGEKTDANGFVLEPAKPPLVPQHSAAAAAAAAAPSPSPPQGTTAMKPAPARPQTTGTAKPVNANGYANGNGAAKPQPPFQAQQGGGARVTVPPQNFKAAAQAVVDEFADPEFDNLVINGVPELDAPPAL